MFELRSRCKYIIYYMYTHTYAHRSTTDAGIIFKVLVFFPFCLEMSKDSNESEKQKKINTDWRTREETKIELTLMIIYTCLMMGANECVRTLNLLDKGILKLLWLVFAIAEK